MYILQHTLECFNEWEEEMKSIQPKVLIVILNYGTYELTLNLIKDLRTDLDYDNYSIMVVDNCSPNESAKVLEEKKVEMDYIFYANEENSGYAAGNNIGIRYGIEHGFAYSWILNNDVELREKNVLERMVEIMEQNSGIAVVGPRIISAGGTPVAPFCNRPTFWSMTLGIKQERDYRRTQMDISREVYCVYGCCVLLRNTAMDDIDCMDERTFLYGEENILAERLLLQGYISYYIADVSVKHNESTSMTQMSKDKLRMQIRENRKSGEIYLKDYRHFVAPARWMCHVVRILILYFRNKFNSV